MEEDKKLEKRKILQIIVLGVIIVALLGALIYLLFIRKDTSNEPPKPQDNQQIETNKSYSKIDDSKESYYIIKGNTYDKYENFDKKVKSEYNITFDYPVINIDTDTVRKLNEVIKNHYDTIESGYVKNDNDDCICVKLKDGYYCGEHIDEPDYGIYETSEYIILKLVDFIDTFCASGGPMNDYYTVSKKDGKVLSTNEIFALLNIDKNEAELELKKYISSHIEDEYVNSKIDDKEIFIYNNKIIIQIDCGDYYTYVEYDGKTMKKFDEGNIDFNK